MTKRAKVIKAFEFCLMPPSKKEIEDDICSHEDCPYYRKYNGGKCISAAASDALALLKAQEPRVMTLEEAKSVEGYAWLECRDRDVLSVSFFRGGFYIEPFERPLRVDLMNWADYNKGWRYWTSCPTDAQREATPWERLN